MDEQSCLYAVVQVIIWEARMLGTRTERVR
jgi:hypothetical protein